MLLAAPMERPLDLMFGGFETGITFLSALIVSGVVADGATNWLEGSMLLFSYLIICCAFFFYNSHGITDKHYSFD